MKLTSRLITLRTKPRIVALAIISTCFLILLYICVRSNQIDFKNLQKPGFTDFDELKQRHRDGFFDNIQLKDLLQYTKFLSTVHTCVVPPRMVTLIQSACSHQEYRHAIRETWGHRAKDLGIPVVFFVGQCPDSRSEQTQFKDIVEVDFVDSYYNNTLKSLARYRWFLEHCASADFLFMADDDTVVVLDLLLDLVNPGIGYSMVGPLYEGQNLIFRRKDSKWYIPTWSWPAAGYPTYLGGWSYVVNGSVIPELYAASLESRFITVDDALFTGIVAHMAGIHRIGDPRFPLGKDLRVRCDSGSIISTQFLTPLEIRTYWRDRQDKCAT